MTNDITAETPEHLKRLSRGRIAQNWTESRVLEDMLISYHIHRNDTAGLKWKQRLSTS